MANDKTRPVQFEEVFEENADVDEDSYLDGEQRRCPEHGLMMPIALPYAYDVDADQPQGYHLVCPRCRYTFDDDYIPDNQQWMGR